MKWKEFENHIDIVPIREADLLIIEKVNKELESWIKTTFNNLNESKDAENEFVYLFFNIKKKYNEQLIKPIASYETLIKGNDNKFPILFNETNLNRILTIFHSIFHYTKVDDRINLFKKSFFEFKIAKSKYLLLKHLIEEMNENVLSPKNRLPDFDTFEISILQTLKDKIEIAYKSNDSYRKHLEESQISLEKSKSDNKERLQLIQRLDNDLSIVNRAKSDVEMELKIAKNQFEIIKNHIPVLESSNVIQFDNTYWGDNYPALKVFFNFLNNRGITCLNWSLFASQMCIDDNNPIDLTLNDFSKKDYGFMFYLLKEFFVFDIKKDRSSYDRFLNLKFRINGHKFKKNDISKFVRNYGIDISEIGKIEQECSELKNQKMIEKLYLDIKTRFF